MYANPTDFHLLGKLHEYVWAADREVMQKMGPGSFDMLDSGPDTNLLISRLVASDPTVFASFALDDHGDPHGGVVATQVGNIGEVKGMRSFGQRDTLLALFDSVKEWASARGLRGLIGVTHRSPKAWARVLGFEHVRDLVVKEI